jgi:hypothetical protein
MKPGGSPLGRTKIWGTVTENVRAGTWAEWLDQSDFALQIAEVAVPVTCSAVSWH